MKKVGAILGVDARIFFHESRFLWWRWLSFRKSTKPLLDYLEKLNTESSLWSVRMLWPWTILENLDKYSTKERAFIPCHFKTEELPLEYKHLSDSVFFDTIDAYLTYEPAPMPLPAFEWLNPYMKDATGIYRVSFGTIDSQFLSLNEYFQSEDVVGGLKAQEERVGL